VEDVDGLVPYDSVAEAEEGVVVASMDSVDVVCTGWRRSTATWWPTGTPAEAAADGDALWEGQPVRDADSEGDDDWRRPWTTRPWRTRRQ
jgi:hypothetical protein